MKLVTYIMATNIYTEIRKETWIQFTKRTNRRWYQRLIQFYEIQNNLTTDYLKPLIPSLFGQHFSNVLPNIFCRTDIYTHSFYPDSVRCWNGIRSQFWNQVTYLHNYNPIGNASIWWLYDMQYRICLFVFRFVLRW